MLFYLLVSVSRAYLAWDILHSYFNNKLIDKMSLSGNSTKKQISYAKEGTTAVLTCPHSLSTEETQTSWNKSVHGPLTKQQRIFSKSKAQHKEQNMYSLEGSNLTITDVTLSNEGYYFAKIYDKSGSLLEECSTELVVYSKWHYYLKTRGQI